MRNMPTIIGNPMGAASENPPVKKPKSERIGGVDVGGSMGEIMSRVKPETPEEKAARFAAAVAEENRIVAEFRAKIGTGQPQESPLDPKHWRKGGVIHMPAMTPEMIAALSAEKRQKAMKKAPAGEEGKLKKFFRNLFG